MAPPDGHMTDDQRRKLEAALAASLLLLYRGHAQEAMRTLEAQEATIGIPLNVRERVNAFAADRALKVQRGINKRMDMARRDLPDDATEADAQQAVTQARSEIADHNHNVLMPFLTSWAAHQALVDTYQSSTTADGRNAAQATQWQWTRLLENPPEDDCQEANDLGPASLDEIYGITGGPPPLHPSCACQLGPA